MSEAPPTPDDTATSAAGSGPALVGVLVAVLVAVMAGTWAASVGPRDVLSPEPAPTNAEQPEASQEEPPAESEPSGESGPEPVPRQTPDWLLALSRATQIAVLAVLGYFGLRWLLRQRIRLRRRRAKPIPGPPPPEFDVSDDPTRIAEELAAAASEQRDDLSTGEPRNAIVACWHRFEVAATAAGMARRPWETPAEFVRRVLGLVEADERAVSTLAALYREARFSEHPVGEDERLRAEEALETVHRGLGARTAGRR